MGGGLIQLVAVGAQDKYLTSNPTITFFKTVYKKHTNFSMETTEEIFSNNVDFGQRCVCTVPRTGDLVADMCLAIQLPDLNPPHNPRKFKWSRSIGHLLVHSVELTIGSTVIDKHYGEWFEIWMELVQSKNKEMGYNQMTGKNGALGGIDLYVPLNFWFCRNIGLALPLIALQYHQVEVIVKFNEFHRCWSLASNDAIGKQPAPVKFTASLLVDYVFLDLEERKKFAQMSHMYLIDQLQCSMDNIVTGEHANIDLNFNHPVKEIIWVVQRTDVQDVILSKTGKQVLHGGNDWFNYRPSLLHHANQDTQQDTFTTAVLYMNGMQRFKPRAASYFRQYVPYVRHSRMPSKHIYCYSFSLNPESEQPMGSCNFSRIENVKLSLKFNAEMHSKKNVKVFAINHNILIIKGGMGACGYTN